MNSPLSNRNKLLVGRKKNRRIRKKRKAYAEHTQRERHAHMEPEPFRNQWSQAKAAHTYHTQKALRNILASTQEPRGLQP